MQKGEAVPFILIDENINNKEVQYSFKIHPKAHEVFNSDSVKNKKVAIAAVAGPQRTGKSFLSNRLLKRMNGFAIGPSTMPCTKGLWIWGQPIKVSDDTVLIIMDTEGLNSKEMQMWIQKYFLFLFYYLQYLYITRTYCYYQSIGHIDEKALQNMSYVLRVSENIKISSDNQSDNQMSKYFPYFYWVLRDFSLDLKGMTQSEYLQQSLKPINNDERDPRNQIRCKIRKLFAHRKCECFPRPVFDEGKLAHIEQQQYDQLRQNFRNKMKNFQRTFFSNLPPKTINNKPIVGSIYLSLAYQYVNAMNNGKIPKIMNSLESVIASEVRKACDSYKNNYKNAMDQIMKADKMPLQQTEIDKNYKHFLSKIQNNLNEKFKTWGDVKVVQVARTKLLQQLANDVQDRLKQNAKLAEVGANRSMLKLFDEITLPDLKNSQMITTSLVSQKQQQFSKKYIEYLQQNKAPSKYIVFTKKFPTLIFDYFGKLIARIKGVYSDQLAASKNQTKNSRNQIQSVKRIMKEQENLILQKQKQVESINYIKQQMNRQLKLNKQLSTFQQQSQKMSKNQMKRTLDDLKRQILQLENQKQQVIDINEKLVNENTNLKKNVNVTTIVNSTQNSTKNTQKSQQTQNLPTQLVYALIQLRGKLSVMNEFYDKKTKDQTLDQYMNRQIEQYRNDKYLQIQKIKQQYKNKIQQYRYKIQKLIQTYQKQLNVINLHLDDIKNQNMELRKKISDNPGNDKKINGFIAEKKKFQQALRMKQNHLNSQIALNAEKQRQIEQLNVEKDDICQKFAKVSAEKANLDSFKGSFWYLLRQSINYSMNKGNKLKHAIKSLDNDDKHMLQKTFNEVGLKWI